MSNENQILDNISFSAEGRPHIQLRDNSQRARTTKILLWVVIGWIGLMLICDLMQYSLIQDAYNGFVSDEAAEANDLRQMVVRWLYLAIYITYLVFLIRWFRRAYYNLGLAGLNTRFSEGWAAGAWFVPIVNLGRPYLIMNEIWEKQSVLLDRAAPGIYDSLSRGKAIVGIWWTFEIISIVIGRIDFSLSRNAHTLDLIMHSTQVSIAADCIYLITSLLLFSVVKRVSEMEREIYDNQHLLEPHPATV